jgi:hypothetical protein
MLSKSTDTITSPVQPVVIAPAAITPVDMAVDVGSMFA